MRATIQMRVTITIVGRVATQLTSGFIDETHSVEVEHETIGCEKTRREEWIRLQSAHFMNKKHLRLAIHAVLSDGKQELNIAVMSLKQIIISFPLLMQLIDAR